LKLDAEIFSESLGEVGGLSKSAEAFGFDCVWFNEIKHDPFVQLAIAASSTSRVRLGTSIALAFTRSPTTLAYSAWDVQSLSGGRLILGLGTQVKGHIERRFGGRWESPAAKMKDVVGAMRAVWRTWQTGERLDYKGRFFSIDLMTPFFSPSPIESPEIPVYLAGVNPGMCRLAGEVAEGLHVHPLHSAGYLREVVDPALAEGLKRSGRERREFTVAASVFAAVGDTEEERRSVREALRGQVAFYASTRTYRRLMEHHGWGDVCDRLHSLSLKGEWGKMSGEIGDDILEKLVVEGTWAGVGSAIKKRYDGLVDRVRLYMPFDGEQKWRSLTKGFTA
jgi:probable F420-dependent oxidoreductase